MKRRDGLDTASGGRYESLNDQFFSKFPKFLQLSEQEKDTFREILKGAREKVDGRKKNKSELLTKNGEINFGKLSKTALDDASPNREGFVALSETEKEIYFATLKRASDNTNRKKKNSRTDPRDEKTLSVAVNLISKDNERIQKASEETNIKKQTNRIEREKLEDKEDLLLLDIISKRPEKDVSTKGIFSETNFSKKISSENDNFKRSSSFIDHGKNATEISSEPKNRDFIARDVEPWTTPDRPLQIVAEENMQPPDALKIVETDQIFEIDKNGFENINAVVVTEETESVKVKEANLSKEEKVLELPDLTKLEESGKSGSLLAISEPETESTTTIEILSTEETEMKSKLEEPVGESAPIIRKELQDVGFSGSATSLDQEDESITKTVEKSASLESLLSDKEEVSDKKDSADFKEKDLSYSLESGRQSLAEEVSGKKSELSLFDSDASKTSIESSEEADEPECVPIYDKKLTAPKSRVRTLQDLLKDRAVLVVDSTDRFKIEWKPKDRIPKTTAKIKESALSDLDPYEEETKKEKKKNKVISFLEKMFACGRKETEKEDAVAENLKGESVSVEMGTRQRNAASATLDDATIEVLEAAKRKRIIAQYTKQN